MSIKTVSGSFMMSGTAVARTTSLLSMQFLCHPVAKLLHHPPDGKFRV